MPNFLVFVPNNLTFYHNSVSNKDFPRSSQIILILYELKAAKG